MLGGTGNHACGVACGDVGGGARGGDVTWVGQILIGLDCVMANDCVIAWYGCMVFTVWYVANDDGDNDGIG